VLSVFQIVLLDAKSQFGLFSLTQKWRFTHCFELPNYTNKMSAAKTLMFVRRKKNTIG